MADDAGGDERTQPLGAVGLVGVLPGDAVEHFGDLGEGGDLAGQNLHLEQLWACRVAERLACEAVSYAVAVALLVDVAERQLVGLELLGQPRCIAAGVEAARLQARPALTQGLTASG